MIFVFLSTYAFVSSVAYAKATDASTLVFAEAAAPLFIGSVPAVEYVLLILSSDAATFTLTTLISLARIYASDLSSEILRATEAPTPTADDSSLLGFFGLFLSFFAGSLFLSFAASPEFSLFAVLPLLFLSLSFILATVSPSPVSFACLPSSTAPLSLTSGMPFFFMEAVARVSSSCITLEVTSTSPMEAVIFLYALFSPHSMKAYALPDIFVMATLPATPTPPAPAPETE